MRLTTIPRWLGAGAAAIALVGAAACSPPTSSTNTGSGSTASSRGAVSAATATSATAMGSMDALVAAAKKEGALNVIALSPTWANYKEILDKFAAKYPEIKITSDQPDASSADEIATAQRLRASRPPPDVFDISQAVANANVAMFAPYRSRCSTRSRPPQGRQWRLGQRLRRTHDGRVRLGQGPRPDLSGRPAQACVCRQGGPQR